MKMKITIMKKMTHVRDFKKTIKTTLIVGFFMFIISYIIFNTRLISQGVNLEITGIKNGEVYDSGSLEISGKAARSKHLLVNGREIFINPEGEFSDVLILPLGYNVVVIRAEDRFGKVTEKRFEIIRKQNM